MRWVEVFDRPFPLLVGFLIRVGELGVGLVLAELGGVFGKVGALLFLLWG